MRENAGTTSSATVNEKSNALSAPTHATCLTHSSMVYWDDFFSFQETDPHEMSAKRDRPFSKVDLPDPFGPITPKQLPFDTLTEMGPNDQPDG
jgi:hypothetical protein